MASLLPLQEFIDSNGNPLIGGTLTAYVPNTTTLKTIYTSYTGLVAMSNPTPAFDNLGRISGGIWGSGLYDIVVKDVNGNIIWSLGSVGFAPDNTVVTAASLLVNPNRIKNGCFTNSPYAESQNNNGSGVNVLAGPFSNQSPIDANWTILASTAFGLSEVALIKSASTGPATSPNYLLLQNGSTSQAYGVIQTLDSFETAGLRGELIQATASFNCTSASTFYLAILSQSSGTLDAPVVNVVNSWTNPSFIPGAFFVINVDTTIGLGSATLSTSGWVTVTASMVVPQSSKNLQFFIFTTSSLGSNAQISLSECGLNINSTAPLFMPNKLTDELKDAIFSNPITYVKSLLINSDFKFDQRNVATTLTGIANNTYSADGWYVLTQTNSVQYSITANSDNTSLSKNMYTLNQSNATSQSLGVGQVLSSANSQALLKQQIYCGVRVTGNTNSMIINMALLVWTGTADSVTRNVVASWQPVVFNTTTLTKIAQVSSASITANVWQDLIISGFIPPNTLSNTNNFIIFIWTENALQNQSISIGSTIFNVDSNPILTKKYQPNTWTEDLALCKSFYEKTYDITTVPGTVTETGSQGFIASGTGSTAGYGIRYATKYGEPTVTFYSPVTGASANIANITATSDVSVTAVNNAGQQGINSISLGTALVNTDIYSTHYTVKFEL